MFPSENKQTEHGVFGNSFLALWHHCPQLLLTLPHVCPSAGVTSKVYLNITFMGR